MKPELPGQVLVELREDLHFMTPREFAEALQQKSAPRARRHVGAFAELCGWSPDTERRLEAIKWNSDPSSWQTTLGRDT